MLNVIAGILAKDPSIKEINKGGEKLQVSNASIYIKMPEGRKDIPVNISAWGHVAKELQGYKKGESVHFIGAPNDSQYKNEAMEKPITTLGYTVLKIDHEKKLLKEMDSMLSAYIGKDKEKSADAESEKEKPKNKSKAKDGGDLKATDNKEAAKKVKPAEPSMGMPGVE